jgi:3-oxoacyl-[acyl-carrier protein] reductase
MKTAQKDLHLTTAKRLDGKVAVVTGGSRGIGAAIALRLASEGATVAITYNNSSAAAQDVVAKISEFGVKGLAVKANASSEAEAKKLAAQVAEALGPIDILVNNAGVFEAAPIDQITLDHYQRVFDVNVKGVIATTIAALKYFADGGRIINISSGAGSPKFAMPGMSVYSATKAALDTLSRIWAQELGPRQITVNSVAPGATASDMYDGAMPEEVKATIPGKTALRRVGQPEDIAAVVAFLASDDGRWVTGQSIGADGGIVL